MSYFGETTPESEFKSHELVSNIQYNIEQLENECFQEDPKKKPETESNPIPQVPLPTKVNLYLK
jgi:hypothetical protein